MTGLRRAGGDGCSRASISENSRRICPRIPILTCFCHSARLAGRTWTLCTGPRSDLPTSRTGDQRRERHDGSPQAGGANVRSGSKPGCRSAAFQRATLHAFRHVARRVACPTPIVRGMSMDPGISLPGKCPSAGIATPCVRLKLKSNQ